MLVKIKEWVTKYGGYILTPLTLLLGYIFYQKRKNEELQNDNDRLKQGIKTTEATGKIKEAESNANTKVSDYKSLRDEYLKSGKE